MAVKRLLSTKEAAKILGISRISVFNKIRKGRMDAMMIGGVYAIKRKAIVREKVKMKKRDRSIAARRRKRKNTRPMRRIGPDKGGHWEVLK